jgi:Fe-S cluster biogenesis protein NfuA
MTRREGIEYILERIRPALVADGGDLELVSLDGDVARIRLLGACAGCPNAHITIQTGIEGSLRRLAPQLRVVAVS